MSENEFSFASGRNEDDVLDQEVLENFQQLLVNVNGQNELLSYGSSSIILNVYIPLTMYTYTSTILT